MGWWRRLKTIERPDLPVARPESPQSSGKGERGFAVCTMPRSGSNVFCDTLARTGVLGRPLEFFNGAGRRRHDDPSYPDDPHEQIARILSMGATPNGIYGFKVFPEHVDALAPHLRWTEVLPRLTFVRLHRRDVLGQALSWVRASQTQQWRGTDGSSVEIFYDADAIDAHIRRICRCTARWDMFFARTGLPSVHIVYEDFLSEPERAVNAVAAAFDLPQTHSIDLSRSSFKKQSDDVTNVWRARFLRERGDPNDIDQD